MLSQECHMQFLPQERTHFHGKARKKNEGKPRSHNRKGTHHVEDERVPSVFIFTSSPVKAAQLTNVRSYERRVSSTEVRLRNSAAQLPVWEESRARRNKANEVFRREQRELAFTRSRAAAEKAAEKAHRAASALLKLGATVDDLNAERISVQTQTDVMGRTFN